MTDRHWSRGWAWVMACLIVFTLLLFPGCGSPEEKPEPPPQATEPPEEQEKEDPEPETEGIMDDIVLPENLITLDTFQPVHKEFTLLEFRCERTGLHMRYECMGVEQIDGDDVHRFRIEGEYGELCGRRLPERKPL